MHCSIASTVLGMVLVAASALAQTNPLREREGPGGAYGPDQPVQPRVPRLEQRPAEPPASQRPAPPQPPPPPFTLTPQEEAQVDRVLNLWEQRNREVKTFDCRFKRWIYDMVFGPVGQAKFEELGVIRYAAPDRGLFRLEKSVTNGKEAPIANIRAEHWMCDGKSVWEYNPAKKQVIEHKLPPKLQGKAIANSPLPFLFGAEAQKLKQRYFIRLSPSENAENEVCLEAYPRFQQDAANFHHAQFIITTQGMSPYALRLVQPNGKDYTVYQFYEVVVNERFRIFQSDPFRPYEPSGWQTIRDETPPSGQARRPPSDGRR
jgi:TIGR03009 family protein